jgi:hypothetical protein
MRRPFRTSALLQREPARVVIAVALFGAVRVEHAGESRTRVVAIARHLERHLATL